MIPKTAPDFANSEESKRNSMLAPAKNQTLTPLNVVSSVTFTNFAFAVGLCRNDFIRDNFFIAVKKSSKLFAKHKIIATFAK